MITKRRKVDLATSITSNYAGELALPYIAAAILSGRTLANRTVRILENVKYKANIPLVSTSSLIAAASCAFSDPSTVTLTEVVLTPTELEVELELCKKDWIPQWEAASMGAGRLGQEVPPNFAAFILEHIAAKIAENIEHHIWNGEVGGATGYTSFDGFIEIYEDSETANSSATIDPTTDSTTTGVLNALETLLGDVSSQVLQDPGFTIYINHKHAFAYNRSLGALGYQMDYYINEKPLNYVGYRMEIANGLPDTTIMCGPRDNFIVGTDLLSDYNEANVIDMALTDGSQNVRVVFRFATGCQIAQVADTNMFKFTG